MPSSDYDWLTDREADYLADPESFDQQERAEIRYRLRIKYANTRDALNRIHDAPELWDKEERIGETEVECRNCWETRTAPQYRYQQTGETTVRTDGWQMVEFVQGAGWLGYCDQCWTDLRDHDMVVEQGRIPCAGLQCNSHEFWSDALADCRQNGNIPFSEEELSELEAQYRDRRHLVCPECGTPIADMTEGEFEYERETWGGGMETWTSEGYHCDCGWARGGDTRCAS